MAAPIHKSDGCATSKVENEKCHVPESIKNKDCWIVWQYEERDGQDKLKKVPKNPRRPRKIHNCDFTDPSNGVPFDKAKKAIDISQQEFSDNGLDGIGLQLIEENDLVGIDLDNIIQNGEMQKWGHSLLDDFDSYSEVSPSGTGAHVLVRGEIDDELGNRNDEIGIEIFERSNILVPMVELKIAFLKIDVIHIE